MATPASHCPLEREFIERLCHIDEFNLAGFQAIELQEGGIAISRRGTVRGVWQHCEEGLRWRPAESAAGGFSVGCVDEALRRMMKIVLASLTIRHSEARRLPSAL